MRTVGITMDIEHVFRVPAPGDTIASVLKDGTYGATYQIVTSREVRRRSPQGNAVPRFALRCRRWPLAGATATWLFEWYPRRRRHA